MGVSGDMRARQGDGAKMKGAVTPPKINILKFT
jgi:hypothetical protein